MHEEIEEDVVFFVDVVVGTYVESVGEFVVFFGHSVPFFLEKFPDFDVFGCDSCGVVSGSFSGFARSTNPLIFCPDRVEVDSFVDILVCVVDFVDVEFGVFALGC